MTTKPDTAPPGRPKDPRVDAALIEAAIEVLNEAGWAAFTTTAVARRAGASTASLYRRWPSKQALAGAVARHIALEELSGIDTGSLEGDVRELLARKRRILEAATGPALLSLMGQAAHDPELRQILHDDVYLAVREQLEALVAQAVRRGELGQAVGAAEMDVLVLVVIGTALARSAFLAPPDPDKASGTDAVDSDPDHGHDPAPAHDPGHDLAETELRLLLSVLTRASASTPAA
ncbi:Nucleoid occlusion factor SlmA [Streptomyces sp. ADI96-02]|uniref:TetR/AcrR family transcriptional regulator n=1 Tax=Streptomyces sp. ADI96-02 TaxID=1522760 RepID=UPI000F554097|nr:TetR/AcrR family transcriptional regulator [Streptomyces sp. ADI96-02]RPK60339.1 Nucleoid occlusion factor SlmA [Streptomyces sp. ADI96-02]